MTDEDLLHTLRDPPKYPVDAVWLHRLIVAAHEAADRIEVDAAELGRLRRLLDQALERQTGEPHVDGWPLYSGLPTKAADQMRADTDKVENARAVIKQCRAALAEELSAWDIDPPLHHVKEAHDACVAWLDSEPLFTAVTEQHAEIERLRVERLCAAEDVKKWRGIAEAALILLSTEDIKKTRRPKLADAGFTRRPGLWALQAREALELIAAPMRPDGTWNRDREACRQLAAEALKRYDDE